MARILIIDDDSESVALAKDYLTADGHDVYVASSAVRALRDVVNFEPDVALLELALGEGAGKDFLRSVRQGDSQDRLPVVVVTRLTSEIDRVLAFELGADDYVVKPFSVRELALRIRALLRRQRGNHAGNGQASLGRIRLDRLSYQAWVDEERLELSLLEFKFLKVLCDAPKRVHSREDLVRSVWGDDANIGARSVDAYVKRLRKKLGPARHFIQTVRGVGYRLMPADVARVS